MRWTALGTVLVLVLAVEMMKEWDRRKRERVLVVRTVRA